jgi:hypothetical protein
MGINLQESCCGNRYNTLNGLSILGNTISGALNVGVLLNGGSAAAGTTAGPRPRMTLSNVLVQANTIRMTPAIYNGCNCYPGDDGNHVGRDSGLGTGSAGAGGQRQLGSRF